MEDSKYKNAWDLYERKEYLKNFYYYYEDVTRVVRGYPKVKFRHLISPRQEVGGGYIPIFDGTDVTQMFLQKGYDDTKEILSYYLRQFPHEGAAHQAGPTVQSNREDFLQNDTIVSFDKIRDLINESKELAS